MNMKTKKFLRSLSLSCGVPRNGMRRQDFRQISYTRWAFSELSRYVEGHPNISLFHNIEDFRLLMDQFCCKAQVGSDANYMFSVAYDFASYALDRLIDQNGGCDVVIVMCDTWKDAQRAYKIYQELLDDNEPPSFIVERNDYCCCLQTDEDIRYIFVDRRMAKQFNQNLNDFIDVDMFLYEMNDYYTINSICVEGGLK